MVLFELDWGDGMIGMGCGGIELGWGGRGCIGIVCVLWNR